MWGRTLSAMHVGLTDPQAGLMIPIVGRDLMLVEAGEGGPLRYDRLVAERLVEELGVDRARLMADYDTNDVICAAPDFRGNPDLFNWVVPEVVKKLRVTPLPHLEKMAAIPAFKIFATTTYDPLLEQALLKARGRPPTIVDLASADAALLDPKRLGPQDSVLVHLFGRAVGSQSCAVTEGQVLERMVQLAERGRSYEFLNRLHESHLMMLGVSFPDWLARSLIRIARQRPLWDSRNCIEVVVDREPLQADFARFIRAFSPSNSLVFDSWSPADFVNRLHEQWFEKFPETRAGVPAPTAPKRAVRDIFISYANEDLQFATSFARALRAAGLEVWFDRRGDQRGLRGGDDFDAKIAGAIREACAFVPLISQHCNVNSDRYFRDEWALAIARQSRFTGLDRAFIVPVVIDGSDVEKLRYVRDEIKKLHAERAPDGVPSADLISRLRIDQETYEPDR